MNYYVNGKLTAIIATTPDSQLEINTPILCTFRETTEKYSLELIYTIFYYLFIIVIVIIGISFCFYKRQNGHSNNKPTPLQPSNDQEVLI